MSDIFLGHDTKTGKEFCVPESAFQTHFHLIGGTGKGKTTASCPIHAAVLATIAIPGMQGSPSSGAMQAQVGQTTARIGRRPVRVLVVYVVTCRLRSPDN